MNPAKQTRIHKQTWPELYCPNDKCLWRVKRDGKPDTPCPKHSKKVLPGLTITEV